VSVHLDRYLDEAERLLDIGHVDGAIDRLRLALTEDPDFAGAHALLALCLLRKRRLHAAGIEARSALALAPDAPLTHWVAAQLDLARRDVASAERHAEHFRALAPESPAGDRLLARCYALTGQRERRLPLLEQALEKDPTDPETLAELARHHNELGRLDVALRFANDALRASPENSSALVAMGETLLARGDVEGAREHAALALRADAADQDALRLLTSIKARTSPLLSLWWRYAVWGERVGPTRQVIVLLVAFVLYRVSSIAAAGAGAAALAGGIEAAWLAVVVYSFVGPVLFRRALDKELAEVKLARF
jgi:tetratricopeptide (TPR) repeat protein